MASPAVITLLIPSISLPTKLSFFCSFKLLKFSRENCIFCFYLCQSVFWLSCIFHYFDCQAILARSLALNSGSASSPLSLLFSVIFLLLVNYSPSFYASPRVLLSLNLFFTPVIIPFLQCKPVSVPSYLSAPS